MFTLKALLVLALSSLVCLAQSSAGGGTIQGTVKDTQNAAIAGAKLIVRQIDTARVTHLTANDQGYFSTPPLSIGKYRVRVEAPGMKAWEGDLQLETGRITDLEPILQLGQVNETVVVSSSVPLVQTTDPTDGSTLDSQRIKELPINGRDLNTLLGSVAPGVEPIIDVNGGIRAGGLMGYSTNYVQDGASSNNREFGGSMNIQGLESIGEVRVETSTSSAKYSAPTSVIVTTKGGTNQIRGSLYETMRNNAFGVARARQDVFYDGTVYKVPKLIRNEFGGSIGGPVFLPTFGLNGKQFYNGKSRTFFFVSREGTELVQGLTRDFAVPTAAFRAGDFSGLRDNQGRFLQLYDPQTTRNITLPNDRTVSTRDPFQNNQIPIQRISPLARRIYAITPLPTDIVNPLVANNYKAAVPTNGNPNLSDNPTTIRIDHRFTENDNVFLKVNGGQRYASFIGTATGIGAPTANKEANMTFLPMQAVAASISWTHTFSSRLFVETLASRTWQSTKTVTGVEQKDWAKDLGLPNPLHEIGFPNITSLQTMTYTEGDNRRALRSGVLNLEQNYTFIKRTHNIQFGARFRYEKESLLPDQGAISGSAAFNSLATALESTTTGSATAPAVTTLTGNDAANFFLGHAAIYSVGLKRSFMNILDRSAGFYLQDNFRVNNRLTITPGLRWDLNPALIETGGLLNTFDIQTHSLMFPEPIDYYYKIGATTPQVVKAFEAVDVKFTNAAQLKRSKDIFPSNYFDIGPRAGFAYRMGDRKREVIIRGGYGVYISALPMRTLLAQFSGLAPFRANFSYAPNSAAQSPDGISNFLLRNPNPIVAGANSASTIDLNNPNAIARGIGVLGLADKLPSLRIHEWNLAIEKQLSSTMVFRLRFNGKHGVNSDQLFEINPTQTDYVWYLTRGTILPQGAYSNVARRPYDQTAYTSVRLLQKTGYINTSTFTLEAERRFSKGLGFQAFYTVTNAFRLGGNSFRDDVATTADGYLPGSVPKDFATLNRFLNYDRDITVPKHRVRWNWNYDIPIGARHWLGRNAGKSLNNFIGGWKLSGSGTMLSQYFAMPTGNWGETSNFESYGKKYKILDCRATPATATRVTDERCFEGYLWFNGYISERFIDSRNGAGLRNGVFGLPANYEPAQKPINPWPKGGKTTDPGNADYDTNVVYLPLSNGSTVRVTADTGLHPWRNQYKLGPSNWLMDASLLKFFSVTERVRIRINADLFNVLNRQGFVNPDTAGISSLQSSYGGSGFRPRQLQLTMRIEW